MQKQFLCWISIKISFDASKWPFRAVNIFSSFECIKIWIIVDLSKHWAWGIVQSPQTIAQNLLTLQKVKTLKVNAIVQCERCFRFMTTSRKNHYEHHIVKTVKVHKSHMIVFFQPQNTPTQLKLRYYYYDNFYSYSLFSCSILTEVGWLDFT